MQPQYRIILYKINVDHKVKTTTISSKLTHFLRALPITLVLVVLLSGCSFTLAPTKGIHLFLGNPSGATESATNSNNYLMIKPQYTLSYNNSKGTANWVSWQLNKSWLGTVDRQNNFRPDDTLPEKFVRVTPTVYNGSGYDRGHIIPSADRTKSVEDNSSTFLMTNMMPQTPDNNRKTWEGLERYCRELVQSGKELYVIAGPLGTQGKLKGKVTIPKSTWKIVVVLDKPGAEIKDITSNTRIIAVNVPNEEGINFNWKSYRVSVDKLEKLTGYNFLSNVPDKIQDEIEDKLDTQKVFNSLPRQYNKTTSNQSNLQVKSLL
jgi:endonuclease G, mitochondrial